MHGLPDVPLEAASLRTQQTGQLWICVWGLLAVIFLRFLIYTAWISVLGGCSKLGAEGLQRLRTLRLFEREPCRLLGVESESRVTCSGIALLYIFRHFIMGCCWCVSLSFWSVQILLSRLWVLMVTLERFEKPRQAITAPWAPMATTTCAALWLTRLPPACRVKGRWN